MSTLHLDNLLNPKSIAVVGASDRDGAPGKAIAKSLLDGKFGGELHFVNPRYTSVFGRECLKSLKKLESPPSLIIILVPEKIIRRTLTQAAGAACKVVIIMSAVKDLKTVHAHAERLNLRVIGPYCTGIVRPHLNLNASYSNKPILKGSLAMVTQSAALGAAILDWAEPSGVGFSAVLSAGADTNVTLPDILDLLSEDHHTKAIIVYLDHVRHTRGFLSAISAAARTKPVVLMKSTQDAARYCDALARTGPVYSTEPVFQSAMRRAGVVRIRTFTNLFSAAKILTSGVRIKGKRLAIISNGSAPAMLAFERISSKGYGLPVLSDDYLATLSDQLANQLGSQFAGRNPIILRNAEAATEHYKQSLVALKKDKNIDAVLVLFAPDARSDPAEIAKVIVKHGPTNIPVLTSFMGDMSVNEAREILNKAGAPSFPTPESAADAFDFLYRYRVSQQELLQLPNPTSRHTRADASSARELIAKALSDGDRVLGPQKTRALLSFFDINVLPARRVTSQSDAIKAAKKIGYPVAMKLVSPNVRYKSEVIGTILNIEDQQQLENAYASIEQQMMIVRPDAEFRGVLIEQMHTESNNRSLALSISRDTTFGPVINVGLGGDLAALVHHRVAQLPPLNNFLIDSMLSSPTITNYLGEYRHQKSVSKKGVAHVLRRLSEMACELPDLFSIDINPLIVGPDGAIAMDVSVVLQASNTTKEYEHLAIHPYPWRWMRMQKLKQGHIAQLRPIRPEDGASLQKMVQNMSAESRYFRFMHAINDLSPQMIAQFTKLDYDRQMAFVAVSDSGSGDVIGVGRYSMGSDRRSAEFAVSIADNWNGQGLASALMKLVIEHARAQGLTQLFGDVLATNAAMRGLMKSLNFVCSVDPDDRELLVFTLALK